MRQASGEAGRGAEGVMRRGAGAVSIRFAGLTVTLDASGAAYLPEHGALIVSDLHLEKGSAGAARGRLLPTFDSHDTLQRLRAVIETYKPRRVICLGDSFHDAHAGERMAHADCIYLLDFNQGRSFDAIILDPPNLHRPLRKPNERRVVIRTSTCWLLSC